MKSCVQRNKAIGFACRVRKNLDFVLRQREQGEDVHEVTQIVLSTLGLVVFPWERERKAVSEMAASLTLDYLTSQGWPAWDFSKGTSSTLIDLIRHLRNAVAHGHIWFSSDDRKAENVVLTFRDKRPKEKEYKWEVSITAADLRIFCERFVDLVFQTQ